MASVAVALTGSATATMPASAAADRDEHDGLALRAERVGLGCERTRCRSPSRSSSPDCQAQRTAAFDGVRRFIFSRHHHSRGDSDRAREARALVGAAVPFSPLLGEVLVTRLETSGPARVHCQNRGGTIADCAAATFQSRARRARRGRRAAAVGRLVAVLGLRSLRRRPRRARRRRRDARAESTRRC